MCGIVGYISKKDNPNSLRLGIEALKRLEYRGYDSSGFAVWDKDKKEIISQKAVGKISELEKKQQLCFCQPHHPSYAVGDYWGGD
jgi:glucosamine--fructose-6-phosphate aminotransferase (isomerizing)